MNSIVKSTIFFAFAVFVLFAFGCKSGNNEKNNSGEWETATSKGYTYRFVVGDPMKARFYTLENGLTVILSPNNREPKIRALIGVRAGSNSDPRTHTGLAHYLEHLLFKGTSKFGTVDSLKEIPLIDEITRLYENYNSTTDPVQRKAIYRQIDSVSGVASRYSIANEYDMIMAAMGAGGSNAHTSFDETVYEETIPSNALDKYLAVQTERFRNPVFRLFHTELETVYEEKNRSLDDDDTRVFDEIMNSQFPTTNYGQQTVLGSVEHLKSPSLVAIGNFYKTYYVPSNMSLVMAGDFDPDVAIEKIDKTLGLWKAKDTVAEKTQVERDLNGVVVKEVKGPAAEKVIMSYRLPVAKNSEEMAAAAMIELMLYNGKAGLLDINLNNQQKVLSSSCSSAPLKDYSLIMLEGYPYTGQTLEQVKDLMAAQVSLLEKGEFEDSLMVGVVRNFKLNRMKALRDNNTRAVALMDAFIRHKAANWDRDVELVNSMEKLTKDKITGFSKSLKKNCVIVYKKYGEVENTVKVIKPPITPISINRDVSSSFADSINAMPVAALKPKWIDYDKDIDKATVAGSEILHVLNKEDQLFKISYQIQAGKWNDKRIPVAIQYLEYLGDAKHTSEEIKRMFFQIGCDYSVVSLEEETIITISGLQENYESAMKLFEDFIRSCKPDDAALQKLKNNIMKSREDAKLNKDEIAKGLLSYSLYGAKNPFNYELSNQELSGLEAGALVSLLQDLLQYKHVVVYYGPQRKREFVEKISTLHKIPETFKAVAEPYKFSRTAPVGRQIFFMPYPMVQAEVQWSNSSIPFDTSVVPVAVLFNQYFGTGMGSLVSQTIRESKALAYSTSAVYRFPGKREDHFFTTAYVGTQADKMKEAILSMDELLTALPYSEGMFNAAKESVLQQIANERIAEDDIAFDYLSARKLGVQYDLRKQIYDSVKTIDFNRLKEFYERNISGKNYSYCIIGSPSLLKEADFLKPASFYQLTSQQVFGY